MNPQHAESREYSMSEAPDDIEDPNQRAAWALGADRGNCFEGETDRGHKCKVCGGTGKPAEAPANEGGAAIDISQWQKARFGVFLESGQFQELPDSDPCGEDHPQGHTARWVGGRHDMELLRAALAAPHATTEQSEAVAGWTLVPVEPTEEMKAAAVRYANGDAVYKTVTAEVLRIEEGIYGEVYEAMLAASPAAPAPCATKPAEQFTPWPNSYRADNESQP